MPNEINKASSALTPYQGKHETGLFRLFATCLVAIGLLISSSCTGLRSCGEGDRWFGKDKGKHFISSAMIAAGGTVIAANSLDNEDAAVIGVSVTMATGLSKEFYDNGVKETCFSWKDLVWDFIGASVGASIAAAAVD